MKPKPLDLWDIEQKLGEIMAKKKFPYCKVSAKARQEILNVLLEEVMQKIKQRIKSACEFYLRYKDNPELLVKEYPEFKEEVEQFRILSLLTGKYIHGNYYDYDKYNEWLFKLAFKDVFKENDSES